MVARVIVTSIREAIDWKKLINDLKKYGFNEAYVVESLTDSFSI